MAYRGVFDSLIWMEKEGEFLKRWKRLQARQIGDGFQRGIS